MMDEKSWKTWKSNQNSVMKEEMIQNGVMDANNSMKNFVMDAELCPYSKLVDGTVCNPAIRIRWRNLLMRNESWLLIGIPSRDSFRDRVLGTDILCVRIST